MEKSIFEFVYAVNREFKGCASIKLLWTFVYGSEGVNTEKFYYHNWNCIYLFN